MGPRVKNDRLRWRNRGGLTAGPRFIFEGYLCTKGTCVPLDVVPETGPGVFCLDGLG